MGNDLISRDTTIKSIQNKFNEFDFDSEYNEGLRDGYLNAIYAIEDAPAVITNAVYEAMCTITDQEFEYSDGFWVQTPKGKKIYFEKKRPEGEWKYIHDTFSKRICNRCNYSQVIVDGMADNFCPNCGASMKGGAE